MSSRIYSILLLLCLANFGTQAQSLRFEQQHIELGDVQNWGLQPAVFYFRNTGNNPVFLLRTHPGSDLRIVYPQSYTQAGARDSLLVFYVPRERNSFSTSFEVFGSDSEKPYKLSISGKILSLDECPGSSAVVQDPLRLVRVVEEGSLLPVESAELILTRDRGEKFRDVTDRKGQYQKALKPGLYRVSIKHPDFLSYEGEFYLDRSTLILTFELSKIAGEEIAQNTDSLVPAIVPLPVDTFKSSVQMSDSLDDRYLPLADFRQNNIVFLVDVSSSMRSRDKLPLLKKSMKRLVRVLRSVDKVSLITYANEPIVLAEGLAGSEKVLLDSLLDSLRAYGNTRGVRGLTKAYEIARTHFIPDANNMIIIATDGEFNGEEYSSVELLALMNRQASQGINCSVVGFGANSVLDFRMRQMALAGKGSYINITEDSPAVEEVLVEEIRKRSRHRTNDK